MRIAFITHQEKVGVSTKLCRVLLWAVVATVLLPFMPMANASTHSSERQEQYAQSVESQTLFTTQWKLLNIKFEGLVKQRNAAQAVNEAQEAFEIIKANVGPYHPATATGLAVLAACYDRAGDDVQSEALYQQAMTVLEAIFPQGHPYTAWCQNGLAHLYLKQGKYDQAQTLYQRAMAVLDKTLGTNHIAIASSLEGLKAVYLAIDQVDQAQAVQDRLTKIKTLSP